MANPSNEKIKPLPRAHGRKHGKPLGQQRIQAMQTHFAAVAIDLQTLPQDHSQHPRSFFSKDFTTYWMEIGFGQGEHLAERMQRAPDIGFLGAEPFINGVAGFLQKIADLPKENIRVLPNDALILLRSLRPESLDGIYILNPDPWHKKRHHKRRIVRPETLDIYAKILKPGGFLILSTDVPYLAEWMLTHTLLHPSFEWQAQRAQDWITPPEDWITTRFETKGAKGAEKMNYLIFKKQHKNIALPLKKD